MTELIWNASIHELKRGYAEKEDRYICIFCGESFEKGIIYSQQGIMYESEKYMQLHIEKTHTSAFDYLIKLDKRITGLTDHQNNLLRLFYQGKNDNEVKAEMDIGSASTIRNHRFALKEKERQAKVFIAVMELLKEKEVRRMDRKQELKQQYKESENQAGVFQIRNTKNGKILVLATMNLKTINGKRFELRMGSSMNVELQKEWKEYGEDAFAFEILEILEQKKDEFFDAKDALEKLEEKWLENLQPFGDRGYNWNKDKEDK